MRPSPGVEQFRFGPDGEQGEPLVGLAGGSRVGGVHVHAISAAVQLRGPEPHELSEPGVETDPVELLDGGAVQAVHGGGEGRSVTVEVEAERGCVCL